MVLTLSLFSISILVFQCNSIDKMNSHQKQGTSDQMICGQNKTLRNSADLLSGFPDLFFASAAPSNVFFMTRMVFKVMRNLFFLHLRSCRSFCASSLRLLLLRVKNILPVFPSLLSSFVVVVTSCFCRLVRHSSIRLTPIVLHNILARISHLLYPRTSV